MNLAATDQSLGELNDLSSIELQPLPVEVKVPVAVSCIKPEQLPAKPDYESLKDNDNTPDGTVVLHITRDFAKSLPYQQRLEAIVDVCK
ncbi:hypothetical protein [Massilia suwonensis]|uniref:Uncharacterized protein n=1 Tax=Massilia suwonensis TaxID=648895 RepID=A0ABW0MTJ3_9BURK